MDKELFYKKMKSYFEQGVVREVYSSDELCILCIGERNYIACPYIIFCGEPLGIRVIPEVIRKIVEKNELLFNMLELTFKEPENYEKFLYDLSEHRVEEWKNLFSNSTTLSEIDYDLEAELAELSMSKSR